MATKTIVRVDMELEVMKTLKETNEVSINGVKVVADKDSVTGYSCYKPTNTNKAKVDLFNLPLPTSSSVVNLTNEEINNAVLSYVLEASGVWKLNNPSAEDMVKAVKNYAFEDTKIVFNVYRTNGARFIKDCLPYGKKGDFVTREYCNNLKVGRKFKITMIVSKNIGEYVYLGSSGSAKAVRLDLFNLIVRNQISIIQAESCEVENLTEDSNIDVNAYTKVPCKPSLSENALKKLGLL